MAYDPDLFDAELMVERWGGGPFDTGALSEFLGVSRMAIYRMLCRGRIPRPAWVEEADHGGTKNYWTTEQVARIVLDARPNSRIAERVRVRV